MNAMRVMESPDRSQRLTQLMRRAYGTGSPCRLVGGLLLVIVITVLLLGQEDTEIGMAP